jgi:hypothetical protein
MAYMMDSLGVFKGKLYEFYQHPGTPLGECNERGAKRMLMLTTGG